MTAGAFTSEHEPKQVITNPYILYKVTLFYKTLSRNIAAKKPVYMSTSLFF